MHFVKKNVPFGSKLTEVCQIDNSKSHNKPLAEPMVTQFTDACMHHQ